MSKKSGSKLGKTRGGSTTPPQKVLDHNSQVRNPNKGTRGTNLPYDMAQGNRGMQIAKGNPKSQ